MKKDIVMCFSKQVSGEVRWKKLSAIERNNGFAVLSEERLEVSEQGRKVFKPSTTVKPSETLHRDQDDAYKQFGMLKSEYHNDDWTENPNGLGLCPF